MSHFSEERLQMIKNSSKSNEKFAKRLICQIMTKEQLADCNCRGVRKKKSDRGNVKAIPEDIFDYVVSTVFRLCGVSEEAQPETLKDIRNAINMHCRRLDLQRKLLLDNTPRGKGFWKLNCHILEHESNFRSFLKEKII